MNLQGYTIDKERFLKPDKIGLLVSDWYIPFVEDDNKMVGFLQLKNGEELTFTIAKNSLDGYKNINEEVTNMVLKCLLNMFVEKPKQL